MFTITNQKLTCQTVYKIVQENDKISVSPSSRKLVQQARDHIEKLILEKKPIYGVTTGFGAFKNTVIPLEKIKLLQENLIKSHSIGVGKPLDADTVRLMIFLIINYLSKGHSGIRPSTLDTLIDVFNKKLVPVVPEKGSVGSSGDLAPNAHIILALLGQGKILWQGKEVDSLKILKKMGISPLKLEAKEGLALINNTVGMCANAIIAINEAKKLLHLGDVVGALSAEAMRATLKAYDEDIHNLKPYPNQIRVAKHMRGLLKGSTMVDMDKIQDQYSIRCIPQVHGGVGEAFDYVEKVINTEINSVPGSPIIFVDKKGNSKVISNGNFHGEALAIALDTLGIATSEIANMADRRIATLLDPALNNHLPAFLTPEGGLNSGCMICQYTTASLVSENKVLSHPASVDSIPTSANIEDFVSMGYISTRKARTIVENVKYVLAIELLVTCQAIDFRLKEGYKLGKGTQKAYNIVRKVVPFFKSDSVYANYIEPLITQFDYLLL